MGRSITYTYLVTVKDKDDGRYLIGAMSKAEIAQIIKRESYSNRVPDEIVAQTWKGEKALGRKVARVSEISLPRLVKCPVCEASERGCCVCNYSGITPRNHWTKWAAWQLESIKNDCAIRDGRPYNSPDGTRHET